VSPSSPAKKGSAYRLGSGKSRMPPPQTVEKTKRILGYEDDQNENAMALTREETLNRWDARAQFKIAMDQLRRDLSVKSAQYDACSAKCEAQSRVLSKTVKERDELKDETKRLQRTVEKSKRIGEETVEHIRRDAEEKEERDKRLMREAVSSLRQKVRQLERERDDSREELSETTQSLEKMKQKASKAMEKNTRLQKETTDLRFQIEKLQDQLQRTVDLYEHETLKVELDRATERTKKLQLALDKETKSSAEEIERLELDIEKFEKQAALAQKEKLDLSSHLVVREKELESSRVETKRIQEELETVQSSVHAKEEAFHNAEKQQQLETLEIAETLLKYERENQKLKAELAALDPKFFEEVFECKERCKKRGLVIQKYEMKLRSYCETLGFAFKREPWD
jgi:chromosome segregation ATPase